MGLRTNTYTEDFRRNHQLQHANRSREDDQECIGTNLWQSRVSGHRRRLKDGSVEIIRQYADRIAYWVSEPDRNLYDAMNKGVRAATGDWVIFMNSDDCFADERVVADIFVEDHGGADLVYGHMRRRYERYGVARTFAAEPAKVLRWRMNCSHQSLFTRRSLLLQYPLGDGLSSDYEFLLTAYVEERHFKPVDRIVSEISSGGASEHTVCNQ